MATNLHDYVNRIGMSFTTNIIISIVIMSISEVNPYSSQIYENKVRWMRKALRIGIAI